MSFSCTQAFIPNYSNFFLLLYIQKAERVSQLSRTILTNLLSTIHYSLLFPSAKIVIILYQTNFFMKKLRKRLRKMRKKFRFRFA
jgi:hypothetical protein